MSGGQCVAIKCVRCLGCRKARILPDGPGAHKVHRSIRATKERGHARSVSEVFKALERLGAVRRMLLDLFGRTPGPAAPVRSEHRRMVCRQELRMRLRPSFRAGNVPERLPYRSGDPVRKHFYGVAAGRRVIDPVQPGLVAKNMLKIPGQTQRNIRRLAARSIEGMYRQYVAAPHHRADRLRGGMQQIGTGIVRRRVATGYGGMYFEGLVPCRIEGMRHLRDKQPQGAQPGYFRDKRRADRNRNVQMPEYAVRSIPPVREMRKIPGDCAEEPGGFLDEAGVPVRPASRTQKSVRSGGHIVAERLLGGQFVHDAGGIVQPALGKVSCAGMDIERVEGSRKRSRGHITLAGIRKQVLEDGKAFRASLDVDRRGFYIDVADQSADASGLRCNRDAFRYCYIQSKPFHAAADGFLHTPPGDLVRGRIVQRDMLAYLPGRRNGGGTFVVR